MSSQKEYTAVASNSSEEPLLIEDEYYYKKPQKPKGFRSHLPWATHAFYLLAITGTLAFFLYRSDSTSAVYCARQQNAWSPAIPQILPYKDVMFNGTLDYPSEFRGSPSPSLDAAWESLTRMKSGMKDGPVEKEDQLPLVYGFSISDEDYLKLGHPLTENTVRLTESQGGGIWGGLEVYHQLHCLNMIRQYTYHDYYQNRSLAFTDPPDLVRTHIDHCIEMLRQKLTCDADVGVITHTWVSRKKTPWPNFNIQHKCRNFDNVVEWSLENNAASAQEDMIRPSNIVGLDPPP